MGVELPQYRSTSDKSCSYALNEFIDDPSVLDKRIMELQTVENTLLFRGMNDARYKMYASSQRHWIQKTQWVSAMKKSGYYDFIEEIIRRTDKLNEVQKYMQSQSLVSNDMFLMALMQHFGAPSPMIDFSESLLTSLSFALDNAKPSSGTNDLGNYISLYYVNRNFDWVQSTVQSVVQSSGSSIDQLVREHKKKYPNEQFDVKETLEDIEHLLYRQFRLDSEQSDITFIPLGGPSLGRVKVNIPILNFSCDYEIINDRIVKQQGMFFMNNTESEPLVELMNKITKQKMFCCLNIHKDLIPYIIDKYLTPKSINHTTVYDDDNPQVKSLEKSIKGLLPQLAILVLSCDKYSDLWDDFFNLKERFWSDCPYPCYLATDTLDYQRDGVKLIHFGNIRTWSICARKALEQIEEPYVALFLEDAFIYKKIDTSIVASNLHFCIDHKSDFLTMERNRMPKNKSKIEQMAPHIWRIDCHQKYGIDTSAAIWDKNFFCRALEKSDCNAWEFEVNYCREAETEVGLQGEIFFDDRQPFNISPVEVVRIGKLTPDAIKFYKKLGYDIDTSKREMISPLKMKLYNLKVFLKYGTSIPNAPIKFLAKVLGFKFYS